MIISNFIVLCLACAIGLFLTSKGMLFETVYIIPGFLIVSGILYFFYAKWVKKELNDSLINIVDTPACVNLPYDEVKKYIHKVTVEFNVIGNNESDIKNQLSKDISDYLIGNELISYSLINYPELNDITVNRIICNFVVLTNKNTNSNENPQIS